MPRVGGVYSPPAGTKGVPNTTIQSAPYNGFVDDLVLDANNPRPVTAGGTGATNATGARTNLDVQAAADALIKSIANLTTSANQMIYLTGTDTAEVTTITAFGRSLIDDVDAAAVRTTIGANNASNLSLGTVADARLPTSMTGKTFSGNVGISAGNSTSGTEFLRLFPTDFGVGKPYLYAAKSGVANSWIIGLWDTATITGEIRFDASAVTQGGNQFWHTGNDGPGSGLDADLLDGQHGSYYADVPGRLGFTPIRQGGPLSGGGSNTVWVGLGGDGSMRLQVDTTSFGSTWPMNIAGSASLLGGVAASGYAQVTNTGTRDETNLPVGSVLAATGFAAPPDRNASVGVWLHAGNADRWSGAASGAGMSGTWRNKGFVATGIYETQRTA